MQREMVAKRGSIVGVWLIRSTPENTEPGTLGGKRSYGLLLNAAR